MTNDDMDELIRELVSGQEILTQKIERQERALRALVGENAALSNVASTPYVAINAAREILDETFPI